MSRARSLGLAETWGLMSITHIFLCIFTYLQQKYHISHLYIFQTERKTENIVIAIDFHELAFPNHYMSFLVWSDIRYNSKCNIPHSLAHSTNSLDPDAFYCLLAWILLNICVCVCMYKMHCFSFVLSTLIVSFTAIDPRWSNSLFTELLVHFSKHMLPALLLAFPLLPPFYLTHINYCWCIELGSFIAAEAWTWAERSASGLSTG